MPETAREIAEHLLEQTGEALMTGNFEQFQDCFELPQDMDTFAGRQHLKTVDDLRAVFDHVRGHFHSIGMTSLNRRCLEATFRNDETVVTMHESRVVTRGHHLREPYYALGTIQRIDGVWKITFSQYAISGSDKHSLALMGGPVRTDASE